MRTGPLAIFLLSGLTLSRASAAEPGVSATEILIGQSAALSGPAAGLGTGMTLGLWAALEEANAQGGVHGRRLKLIALDDAYEPDKTVDCTIELIEKRKVFALAGYVGTPTTKVALPIAMETHTPLIGVFSGAMLLRQPVQRYVVNVRASYDDETEALVAHLAGKAARVSVFYQDDSFGLAGLEGVEKALKKRGLQLSSKGAFERNTLAVKTGLARVMEGKPDAVVIVAPYKPTAAFVREARAAGLGAQMLTISFVGTENLIADLGAAAEGMLVSQVVPSPDDAALPIVVAYQKALPKDASRSFVSLEGFVIGRLLVAALEAAGKEPTREKLIDAIEEMSSADLGGLPISFGKNSHQGSRLVFLTRVEGGKARPLPQAHAEK